YLSFQSFWDNCLHDGVFETALPAKSVSFQGDVTAAAAKVSKPGNSEMEVAFFETVNMGAGQYANNPWLMEMPDPITRCVWGNYLAIPVEWDGGKHINGYKNLNGNEIYAEADKVEVEVGGKKQVVTCVKQFGLAPGT